MHRCWTPEAQGRIVSGLDSMVCDRAGMKVEVALGRQGNMGAGNIVWYLWRRLEALGRGKIDPNELCPKGLTSLPLATYSIASGPGFNSVPPLGLAGITVPPPQ